MNKDVIKKYKKEFDYWLNGGELLCSYLYDGDREWFTPSYKFKDDRVTYIINDEHVEYRKALAEGKTVEYMVTRSGHKFSDWETMSEANYFNKAVQYYRIKPDKPEFKVGDYVVSKGFGDIYLIEKIEDNKIIHKDLRYSQFKDLRPWTLEEADDDEWVLCGWIGKTGREHIQLTRKKNRNNGYDFIYPYIGQTPKQLKLEK